MKELCLFCFEPKLQTQQLILFSKQLVASQTFSEVSFSSLVIEDSKGLDSSSYET